MDSLRGHRVNLSALRAGARRGATQKIPSFTRPRVWVKVEGVDADFRTAATVTDSDATLNTFPSGRTVRVRVTAANDAGESIPSAEVQAVVA